MSLCLCGEFSFFRARYSARLVTVPLPSQPTQSEKGEAARVEGDLLTTSEFLIRPSTAESLVMRLPPCASKGATAFRAFTARA